MTNATGRVAIVSGGTRGIGAAITQRLTSQGTRVIAVYRSDREAASALRDTAVDPALVDPQCVDVSDPVACAKLIAGVVAEHGRVDHLVNNAGSLNEQIVSDLTPDDWDDTLRVNLSSAFYMSQPVLEPMRERRFGRIVNLSSVTAVMGSPFQLHYAAAKSGMIGLTRSLARATARRGITVNCVVPGGIATDLLDNMTMTDRGLVESSIPLGRFGQPSEIAHVVTSLLHDDASYVTGSVIVVDGGLSMGA